MRTRVLGGMKLVLLVVASVVALSACGAERETVPAGPSPQPAQTQDVVRLVCQVKEPPVVEFPTVEPQPDGVHFQIVNETDKDLAFSVETPSGGGGGTNAPQGVSTQVVDIPPGKASIACFDPYTEDAGKVAKTDLEIVDEHGAWVPTRLKCAQQFSGVVDYVAGARGKPDPLEAAREGFRGYMEAGDVVEPAGYSQAEMLVFRLVRDGDVVATAELLDDGAGGWLPSTVTGCSSLLR